MIHIQIRRVTPHEALEASAGYVLIERAFPEFFRPVVSDQLTVDGAVLVVIAARWENVCNPHGGPMLVVFVQ